MAEGVDNDPSRVPRIKKVFVNDITKIPPEVFAHYQDLTLPELVKKIQAGEIRYNTPEGEVKIVLPQFTTSAEQKRQKQEIEKQIGEKLRQIRQRKKDAEDRLRKRPPEERYYGPDAEEPFPPSLRNKIPTSMRRTQPPPQPRQNPPNPYHKNG